MILHYKTSIQDVVIQKYFELHKYIHVVVIFACVADILDSELNK